MVDAYLFQVVGPILAAREESRGVYTSVDGALLGVGERTHQPDLAQTFDALAREGEALFYDGELGRRLVTACREQGGLLTKQDLASYRIVRRKPLERRYRDARILTNPPPSTGGILIAFALGLLEQGEPASLGFGSGHYLAHLTRVMALTNQARIESALHEAIGDEAEREAPRRLFDPELLRTYVE